MLLFTGLNIEFIFIVLLFTGLDFEVHYWCYYLVVLPTNELHIPKFSLQSLIHSTDKEIYSVQSTLYRHLILYYLLARHLAPSF